MVPMQSARLVRPDCVDGDVSRYPSPRSRTLLLLPQRLQMKSSAEHPMVPSDDECPQRVESVARCAAPGGSKAASAPGSRSTQTFRRSPLAHAPEERPWATPGYRSENTGARFSARRGSAAPALFESRAPSVLRS
jgi:hypothetical protein